MREILFRGKRVDNGKWVEGYYVYDDSGQLTENPRADIVRLSTHPCGFSMIPYEVIPSTVGQYTGLTDKNGTKIFEGDIVKFGDIIGVINYSFGCFCVKTNKPDWKSRNNPAIDIVFNEYPNEVEIIGNIHDNPELLKGDTENEER